MFFAEFYDYTNNRAHLIYFYNSESASQGCHQLELSNERLDLVYIGTTDININWYYKS